MIKKVSILFTLVFLSLGALAQTTYNASTGSITSTFIVSMNLDLGGSATVYTNFSNCYYPGPCGTQYGQVNYSLPDGSSAYFYPVSMSFENVSGSIYKVTIGTGQATDNQGHVVVLNGAVVNMHTVACHQPRGTCPPKKVFDSGSITITK